MGATTRNIANATKYSMSAQMLLHTEQLARCAAISISITESLMASLLNKIPSEEQDAMLLNQVKIMSRASKGVLLLP